MCLGTAQRVGHTADVKHFKSKRLFDCPIFVHNANESVTQLPHYSRPAKSKRHQQCRPISRNHVRPCWFIGQRRDAKPRYCVSLNALSPLADDATREVILKLGNQMGIQALFEAYAVELDQIGDRRLNCNSRAMLALVVAVISVTICDGCNKA
jgi:hypothetical protein